MAKKRRGRPPVKKVVENNLKDDSIINEDGLTSNSSDRQEEVDAKEPSNNRLNEDVKNEESLKTDSVSKDKDEVIAPPSFRNPLERNLGSGFSDIEFIYPDLKGYWAVEADIAKYLRFGYEFCKKEWVKDYEILFSRKQPGTGSNPNGMVTHEGHTLLIASKELADRRRDFYRNRIVDPRQTIKGNLSKSEMSKRGIN